MKRALCVGINYYKNGSSLFGCVDDAHEVKAVLERHSDGSINFSVKLITSSGPSEIVSRADLKDSVAALFAGDVETALFYFAGHGHIEATGGYLLASDSARGDEGLSLGDLMAIANGSRARNKIIVLDSCHSGIAGAPPSRQATAELSEGMTILTASTAEQYATEDARGGVFTQLFVDALSGAAANLVGDITPGSVYAHIDQSLGPWDQRPVFKTNVKNFVSLRTVQPPISLADLRQLLEFFPTAGSEFPLDPSFEPERAPGDSSLPRPDPENVKKFATLQKFNRVNLLVPVGAPHMWHAAMESKSCKLTVLGEHYRRLVERQRI